MGSCSAYQWKGLSLILAACMIFEQIKSPYNMCCCHCHVGSFCAIDSMSFPQHYRCFGEQWQIFLRWTIRNSVAVVLLWVPISECFPWMTRLSDSAQVMRLRSVVLTLTTAEIMFKLTDGTVLWASFDLVKVQRIALDSSQDIDRRTSLKAKGGYTTCAYTPSLPSSCLLPHECQCCCCYTTHLTRALNWH